jgi:hypothetical protein
MKRSLATVIVLVLAGSNVVSGAEVTTNGAGGGRWSEAATWRGKAVPAPTDDVVIRKGDEVIFDRDDDGKVTCQKLFIDPKGALVFRTESGKQVFCAGDQVEARGPIKLDGTRSAKDFLELRLVGDTNAKRTVKLLEGAALVVWGEKTMPKGRRNVAITCPKGGEKKEEIPGLVDAGTAAMLDLQRAEIANVVVRAKGIDNTDSKPNEKVNIVGNRFTTRGQGLPMAGMPGLVTCDGCDTPLVAKNSFECVADKPIQQLRAIHIHGSPLAELRDNTVLGAFHYGICLAFQDTASLTGNTIEKCLVGFHAGYGLNNIIKQTTLSGCQTGLEFVYTQSAVAEDNSVEGAQTAVRVQHSTPQFTNLQVDKLAKDGVALLYQEGGAVTLINCNVTSSQVKIEKLPAKAEQALVTVLNYLVVRVKDAPADAVVEVRTSKPALQPKAADPNVSNAPALLFEDFTPLPQTLSSLLVRSWVIGTDGKTVPAPEYTLNVVQLGKERKVLKSMNVQPKDSWFRAKPNDPTPTLEVSLK